MAAAPIFLGTMKNFVSRIQNADASALITLVTAGTLGTKVTTLAATSTDTSARDVSLYATNNSISYLLGTISIPAGAGGNSTTGAVDMLSQAAMLPWVRVDENGSKYLILELNTNLQVKSLTTVTSAKEIDFFGHGGNF